MTTITASISSVEAQIQTYSASVERSQIAVQQGRPPPPPKTGGFNPQQQQIVDETNISTEALQKLQEAQEIAAQLEEYLNYLQGKSSDLITVTIEPVSADPDVVISGQSTTLAASITTGTITEKTLELSAEFDDEGNLEDLTITQTRTDIEFMQASFSYENMSFYAAA